MAEFGIEGGLAEDFITHRRAKKAVITRTVLNGFQREADLAKIPIAEAISIAIERGWQGFKAEWLKNLTVSQSVNQSHKPKFNDTNTTWWKGMTVEVDPMAGGF